MSGLPLPTRYAGIESQQTTPRSPDMKETITLGVDLAKNVIQVSELKNNRVTKNRQLSPNKFKELLATQRPCRIIFEACGGSHYWARQAKIKGHEPIILPTQFVAGSRQGQKTDANDALACAIAGNHPHARAVSIKTEVEQGLQAVTRVHQALTKQSTAINNMLIGLLFEFGIKLDKRSGELGRKLPDIVEDADNGLPYFLRKTLLDMHTHYQAIQKQLQKITARLDEQIREQKACRRLLALEGVGPINALGLYLAIGDGRAFNNGRDASACIGVTPKQHSTGGKVRMGTVGKNRGHQRLRYTLFQGAISVAKALQKRPPKTAKEKWYMALIERRGTRCAAMAFANKTVRTAWAMLYHDRDYQAEVLHA